MTIPVTVSYYNSSGKWKGIRRFMELNNIDLTCVDGMIAKIEEVGDASLEREYTFTINNIGELYCAIHATDEHPCPHCDLYDICWNCPLDDNGPICCQEWGAIKDQINKLIKNAE